MSLSIADLHDQYGAQVQLADAIFQHYGGRRSFHGEIETVRVFHDFLGVKNKLAQPGGDRVLVVDGGGSHRFALLGDRLAAMALDNGWAGIVINGCLRDAHDIGQLEIGVMALGTCPIKPSLTDEGETNCRLLFGSVVFQPGDYIYVDDDGIMVSPNELKL